MNMEEIIREDDESIDKLFHLAGESSQMDNDDLIYIYCNSIFLVYKYLFDKLLVFYRRHNYKFFFIRLKMKHKYDPKKRAIDFRIIVKGLVRTNDEICAWRDLKDLKLGFLIGDEEVNLLTSEEEILLDSAKEKVIEFVRKTIDEFESHYVFY